jgi:2-oxo-4-hydroxy-4-carboxy-5-ureidoimidazoline decarboxylase
MSWKALTSLDEAAFCARLGAVVEHSPWVAQQAWARRPFAHWQALVEAMAGVILEAPQARQLALLRSHPELAGQEARAGTMTTDSQSEQGRLGLLALDAATVARIEALNQRYRERFGYPFIVALRLHDSLASVLLAGEARLRHDEATERRLALQQVCEVMRGRLALAVSPDSLSPSTVTALAGSPS